jgi:hypothetical protein
VVGAQACILHGLVRGQIDRKQGDVAGTRSDRPRAAAPIADAKARRQSAAVIDAVVLRSLAVVWPWRIPT